MRAGVPDLQRRGVGARLKWAQREAALAQGVRLITSTHDPMQARNANLNLRRLGATASEFRADFYGITSASLHHGLPTDRLIVRWELDAPRVRPLAAAGQPPRGVTTPAVPPINDGKWQAAWPASSRPRLDPTGPEPLPPPRPPNVRAPPSFSPPPPGRYWMEPPPAPGAAAPACGMDVTVALPARRNVEMLCPSPPAEPAAATDDAVEPSAVFTATDLR